jgi:putative DNA primase/helicase
MTILARLADHGIRPLRHPRLPAGAPGEHRAPCPECDRPKKDKDDALAVRIDGNGASWCCHRCGWRGGIREGRQTERTPQPRERQPELEQHDTLASWGHYLWQACETICRGSVAATYLDNRGCAIPHPCGDLRWYRDLEDKVSGYHGPALVGLVTDVETGEPINLHRTWLASNGSGKAPIDKPRRLLKGHRLRGVTRLWPDEEVTLGLVIGEGIETCLAAALEGLTPVWATMTASNLAAFPVLPGLEGLTLLVDHDRPNAKTGKRAGIEAGLTVVRRYTDAGFDSERDVRVILPPEGEDAADLVRKRRAAA